jgi:hypothetical protein
MYDIVTRYAVELGACLVRHVARHVVDGRLIDVGSSFVVANAAAVPILSVHGATTSISFCWNLMTSSLGSMTIPASPISFHGR